VNANPKANQKKKKNTTKTWLRRRKNNMYGGKRRRLLLCRRRSRTPPPYLLNAANLAAPVVHHSCTYSHCRRSGQDVSRRAWPRAAGPPVVAVPAPGERGTTSPTAVPVPAAQLPRRRDGRRIAAPRRFEDERTKVGREILVVVRIVPVGGRGGGGG